MVDAHPSGRWVQESWVIEDSIPDCFLAWASKLLANCAVNGLKHPRLVHHGDAQSSLRSSGVTVKSVDHGCLIEALIAKAFINAHIMARVDDVHGPCFCP